MVKSFRKHMIISLTVATVCLSGATAMAAPDKTAKGKSPGPSKAQSWYLKTNLFIEDGEFFAYDDRSGVFGRLEGAKSGKDLHDIPVFQPVNGSKAALVFVQDESAFGDAAGQYLSDYRSPGNNKQVWTFTVTTNRSNADVTLYWDGLYAVSKRPDGSYEQVLDNQNKVLRNLRLVDLELGTEVTLAADKSGTPQFYKFNMNGKTQRQFRWVQGNVDGQDLVMAQTQRLQPVASARLSAQGQVAERYSGPPLLVPAETPRVSEPVGQNRKEK